MFDINNKQKPKNYQYSNYLLPKIIAPVPTQLFQNELAANPTNPLPTSELIANYLNEYDPNTQVTVLPNNVIVGIFLKLESGCDLGKIRTSSSSA